MDVISGDKGLHITEDGEVVGIIWTSKIPKMGSKIVTFKDSLDQPTEDVWSELSYTVPTAKIGSFWNLTTEKS